jgi:flagellar basal body-associated protein FliL
MTWIVVALILAAVFGGAALVLAWFMRKWNAEQQAERDAARHSHYDNYAFVYDHPGKDFR